MKCSELTALVLGNAKIAGMESALNIAMGSTGISLEFEVIWMMDQITSIVFVWIVVLLTRIPAHIFLAGALLSQGIVTSLQSVVTSYTAIFVLRSLLGIANVAISGIPIYLSFFYRHERLGLPVGIWMSSSPLLASLTDVLAWAIMKLGYMTPISTWRILFLVEGLPSILLAAVTWKFVKGLATANHHILSEEKVSLVRSPDQVNQGQPNGDGKLLREVFETIKDPKCYLAGLALLCSTMAFAVTPCFVDIGDDLAYSYTPYYFSTAIQDLSDTTLEYKALSAPPYLLSFIMVIVVGFVSDLWRDRSRLICFHALVSAFGFSLIAMAGARGWSFWWQYVGIYPASVGFFVVKSLTTVWALNSQPLKSKRAITFVILQLACQLGSMFSPNGIYPYFPFDDPFFPKSLSISVFLMSFTALLSVILRTHTFTINKGLCVKIDKDEDGIELEFGRRRYLQFML